ncbi:hypothetical protein EVAR_25256_1 [Eumeta japonica]|uniref:Uncharacterized protein n=1 Tax=Eumeta variegata TaxID=151549 RepID=A0A4C1VRF4_EUMVA|nr:hypothetical protein EVAR_25256_1 [Eumeta japonica]
MYGRYFKWTTEPVRRTREHAPMSGPRGATTADSKKRAEERDTKNHLLAPWAASKKRSRPSGRGSFTAVSRDEIEPRQRRGRLLLTRAGNGPAACRRPLPGALSVYDVRIRLSAARHVNFRLKLKFMSLTCWIWGGTNGRRPERPRSDEGGDSELNTINFR